MATKKPIPPAPRVRPWTCLISAIILAGAWGWYSLGLGLSELLPGEANLLVVARFFAGAVSPALDYQSEAPPGTIPLLLKAAQAAGMTVVFAAAAMSAAFLIGFPLGVLASSVWWLDMRGESSSASALAPLAYTIARIVIGLLRSIHELLWAVLFLAAFGLTPFSALLALAIPYGGILAKGISELLDEAPRSGPEALRAGGALPLQRFCFGTLPCALPDLVGYFLYLFECALRSSAVMGFFGFPTLGYFLSASFENLFYREVWTYLYAMFALVIITDVWSSAVRRRLAA